MIERKDSKVEQGRRNEEEEEETWGARNGENVQGGARSAILSVTLNFLIIFLIDLAEGFILQVSGQRWR